MAPGTPPLDPLTQEIISWAKRAAKARGGETLTTLDFLCGVYAVGQKKQGLREDVKAILGENPTWSEAIVELFRKAAAQTPVEWPMPLDGTLLRVVDRTYGQNTYLPAPLLLTNLFAERDDLHIATWLQANRTLPVARQPLLLQFFTELSKKSARLEQLLSQSVLGQEAAVSMLVQAYWEAALSRRRDGPRGIFTFLGPPGVGKTLMAETFAQALAEIEGNAYAFRRFDMASYAGHQNFEQLFGAEEFYKGARPGTLTGFVAEHPRAVILFDEIEKAHENTLTALLPILDKGEARDKQLEKTVSFRECFFILTTNLGQEFFANLNIAGIMDTGTAPRALVLDILSSAKRRREAGDEEAPPALPPELVSRLAKGGVVFFRALSTSSYLTLVHKTLRVSIARARETTGLPLPELRVDDDTALLFLLSLLPAFDARQVVARTEAWAFEVMRQAFEHSREQILATSSETFFLQVRPDPEMQQWLERKYQSLKLQIVVVDDDDYLVPPLRKLCEPFSGEVYRARSEKEVLEAVRRRGADLVLLDLSIHQPPESSDVEEALNLLRSLRARFPEIPVWLFSENPEARGAFARVLDRVLKQGGARGFIPCAYDRRGGTLDESFLVLLREHAILDAARDKLLARLRREHKTLSFVASFRYEPVNSMVEVSLGRLREELVVSLADQAGAIKFSGVPSERFSSVVGLTRAKRRLQQVVSWLRDPSALAPFGENPPRGFLLAGPPGTGKTLLAKAVAGEAGLPFLALSASELRSKWYGESEERVRELFARAREYAPSIVFIDEIDSIGQRRDRATGEANTGLLQQLLASMDGLGGSSRPILVLAATNHAEFLDPALLRPGRFDETIPVDLPNREARRQFFLLRLASIPHREDLDLESLLQHTAGLTPAALDRIVREAVYAAAARGQSEVGQEDLETAVQLVRFGAPSETLELVPEEKKRVAYHEAGHAVAMLHLFPERRIDYVTILPREDRTLGFVALGGDEDRHLLTRSEVEKQLVVTLAGRQGELLASDGSLAALSAGAADDLERATALAWQAVAVWGFDPEVGPLALHALPVEVQGALLQQAGSRVKDWLAAAEARAREIIQSRAAQVRTLASELVERESLDWEDLKETVPELCLVGGRPASA